MKTSNLNTPREAEYLKAWTGFFVCSTVGGMVVGVIVSIIVTWVVKGLSANPTVLSVANYSAVLIASMLVSYFFFRLSVSELWSRKKAELQSSTSPIDAAQQNAQADGPESRAAS